MNVIRMTWFKNFGKQCFRLCLMRMSLMRRFVLRHVAESCLSVPVDEQLSDDLSDDDEFTLTAWFQSLTVGGAVSGTVLSLSSSVNASVVHYSLGFVQFDNGTTAVQFSLQVTHLC